ncbi:glycosyltransferase, group 2 family protein [Providencia rettgeri DSM 1131]|nr:glycosyltransferase, group 2 family protein [Providencia rettgeri DSM 1131]
MGMEMKIKKIAILLATFNGERYLNSQVDSLLNQTIDSNFEIEIHIRDDGSTDNTIDIIKKYELQYNNIYFLDENDNLGAKLSFSRLLSVVEADFYFFCDQDDIWFTDKIENALLHLSYNAKPSLYFSDLNLVNDNGKDLGVSFWQHQGITPDLFSKSENFLYNSLVTGCTIGINRQLRDEFISLDLPWYDIFYHDQMLSILASKIGKIYFSPCCSIHYRQHTNNAVGSPKFSISKKLKIIYLYLKKLNSLKIILKWYNIPLSTFLKNKLFLIIKRLM